MNAYILSGLFNIPADRLLLKIQNLRDASNSDYEVWERIALASGLNRWNLGLGKIESVEEAKERIKQKKHFKKDLLIHLLMKEYRPLFQKSFYQIK